MQVTFSSAIGVAALRAAVRQHSRREVCRITQCGRRRIIPLAILWAYGRRWLILAATQRPRGLLSAPLSLASRPFWGTASPVIRVTVPRRRKRCSFRLEVLGIRVLGFAPGSLPVVMRRAWHSTFRRFKAVIRQVDNRRAVQSRRH